MHHPDSGFRRRLVALTRKELRQLLRDRSNLAIGVILPIVLILIFGYGLSLDIRNTPLAIVLEDSSPAARDVAAKLAGSSYFSTVQVASIREAEDLMRQRTVDGILRIPVDFSRRLEQGGRAHPATPAWCRREQRGHPRALRERGAAGLARATRGPSGRRAGAGGGVRIVERMWFNAANSSTWYLVPGLIALIITLVGAFLTSLVVAREWERGTLESLFVTPVRSAEILLAKIIPYFLVGLLGLSMCLVSARLLFRVPIQGSLVLLLFSSMLYLFVTLGIGLLISARTRNQFLASQVAILSSFLPALMLSGFLFDLRNVPTFIRLVGSILPATYFMELVKTLFLAGDNWHLALKNLLILAGYAVFLLNAARLCTRKKLD
ncbi:ABC transporter permease [Pseudomonas aeruginosa]